jgi:hypothetical protein
MSIEHVKKLINKDRIKVCITYMTSVTMPHRQYSPGTMISIEQKKKTEMGTQLAYHSKILLRKFILINTERKHKK